MTQLTIKTCPTCGCKRIRRVKRDIASRRGGEAFVARGIAIEECANCGERLFSPDALRDIAAQQPQPRRSRRRSA